MMLVIYMDDDYHLSCQEAGPEMTMRVSNEEKTRTRARILDSAARRLRAQGPEGASVADVMRDAGLTHGGFYRHFATKDDLLSAALGAAFGSFTGPLGEQVDNGDATAAVAAFRDLYLSPHHVAHPEAGCPVAAAGSDLGRAAPSVKSAFGDGVERIVALLAEAETGPPDARRQRALRRFALMVGAVVIARASPPDLAAEALAAARTEG